MPTKKLGFQFTDFEGIHTLVYSFIEGVNYVDNIFSFFFFFFL